MIVFLMKSIGIIKKANANAKPKCFKSIGTVENILPPYCIIRDWTIAMPPIQKIYSNLNKLFIY